MNSSPRVLFCNPPWWEDTEVHHGHPFWRQGCRAGSRWPWTGLGISSPDHYRFGDYIPYPYFMGYASTNLARETGAEVHFRDSIALKESYQKFLNFVEHGNYDFIFMESATPSWEADAPVILAMHKRSPRSNIVITGPIAAAKGEEILDTMPVTACVMGEYEKGSVRVVNGETGLISHDMLTREEMNAAPFPYYDALHAKRYWDLNPPGQQRPQAQVWSSRGCPYKCIFCVWPATMTGNDPDGTKRRTVRQYSKEYMEAFLTEIVEKYHYRSIYFDDDTFNLGDKHVLGICEVMARIGLPWSAMCRADTIKLDTWKAMRDSGCFGVKIGFESGNQYVVDHIVKKRLDLEEARQAVDHIKQLGMTVHGTFTFGLPGETKEQMADTADYIKRLGLHSHQESGTAVIEGTPLDTLLREGRLDAYEGAIVDSDFQVAADGAKKLDKMRASMRETA